MADFNKIIDLYSELADKPETDFGWDKGIDNAKAHHYKEEWFTTLPSEIWKYCAAVGNPFSLGKIEEGMCIVDLGCGAGVDLLIAAHLVGKEGKAIGVDITPKMVMKAKEHAFLAGFKNVEVLQSSFEKMDIKDESVDIVISNGAINLTSCKESVFAEIYRILKPEGKLYFADMIDISKEDACCSLEKGSSCDNAEEDWANCVAGTLRQDKLISIIQNSGFKEVKCTGLTHYTTSDTTQGATFKAIKVPSLKRRESHWNHLFETVDYTQVLWHQASPSKSLNLINQYISKEKSMIDVGSGTSFLVDKLLEGGFEDISLLDTSKKSLEIVSKRIQNKKINLIHNDVLTFATNKCFDLWHDRAVFHFLCTKQEQESYFKVLNSALKEEGIAIISTFSTDGPSMCAGLDVVQYNLQGLKDILPDNLEVIVSEEFKHLTPKKSEQAYIYFIIKKRA